MNEYECQASIDDTYFGYVFVHNHMDANSNTSPRKGSNTDIFKIAVIGAALLACKEGRRQVEYFATVN
jgi:hypothetical protein